ncbi:hypothetical protein GCM10020256_03940 [Streptomyces thermocoprophilus]
MWLTNASGPWVSVCGTDVSIAASSFGTMASIGCRVKYARSVSAQCTTYASTASSWRSSSSGTEHSRSTRSQSRHTTAT